MRSSSAMRSALLGSTARESGRRFEIVGRLEDLLLPPLCASCGAKAQTTLVIARQFHRLEGDDWVDVVDEANVPFCRRCVAEHDREVAQGVQLMTSITQAFGFTTELNDLMEPPRRAYFFGNAAFANAFWLLNAGKRWDPHGPAAKRAQLKWKLAILLFVLVYVAMWITSTVFGIQGD